MVVSVVIIVSLFDTFARGLLRRRHDRLGRGVSIIIHRLKGTNRDSLAGNGIQSVFRRRAGLDDAARFCHRPLIRNLDGSQIAIAIVGDGKGGVFRATGTALPLGASGRTGARVIGNNRRRVVINHRPVLSRSNAVVNCIRIRGSLGRCCRIFGHLVLVSILTLYLIIVTDNLLNCFLSCC